MSFNFRVKEDFKVFIDYLLKISSVLAVFFSARKQHNCIYTSSYFGNYLVFPVKLSK